MKHDQIQPMRVLRVFALLFAAVCLWGCIEQPALYQTPSLDDLQPTMEGRFYPITLLGLTEIRSFDVYPNGPFIHVVAAGPAANSETLSVRYLRSQDGGRHWSKPIAIGANAAPPIAARGNDIQIAAADDRLAALWQTRGEFPNQGPITGVYSMDGGKTWRPGVNPAANNAGDQAHIDLATDHNGLFHAVWLEDPEEHGYQSVRYARSSTGGQTWESSKTLDDSTCSCCWNTLLVSASGEINLLYRDMQPRDMALLQSKDNGTTWRGISRVGDFQWQFDGCPHIGGGLTDGHGETSGNLFSVVWTGADNKQGLYFLRSENNGKTWNLPRRLGKRSMHGDIAATGSNHLTAVWDEMGPDGSVVVGSRSEDGGQSWSAAVQLSKAGNSASHPRVINTSAGILAMWTEKPVKQANQLAMVLLKQ